MASLERWLSIFICVVFASLFLLQLGSRTTATRPRSAVVPALSADVTAEDAVKHHDVDAARSATVVLDELARKSSPPTTIGVRKKQAAIIVFGLVRPKADRNVTLHRFRETLNRHVIGPNNMTHNFTILIRVVNSTEAAFIRHVFGVDIIIVDQPSPAEIREPSRFGCGYQMWSHIQVGVQQMRALEVSYGMSDPDAWGAGFDRVLILRTDIAISANFNFGKLNPALFYIASSCVATVRNGKKAIERAYIKQIPCLANETISIPPEVWPIGRELPISTNNSTTCKQHSLSCRVLFNNPTERRKLEMPDYYFLGNSTTMRIMFESIVDDWHRGEFRKSAGHCNHGLLGGRMVHRLGAVAYGRYLHHKIDVQISRYASWYPSPHLHDYLEGRGALWDDAVDDEALAQEPTIFSRCNRRVCTFRDSIALQL